MSTSLVGLNAGEIAKRITSHLKVMEAADAIETRARRKKADQEPGPRREILGSYYMANAYAQGGRVGLKYISYHDRTFISKAEAAHYLAMLDAGFRGRHFEAFRKDPPPGPEYQVRFTALVHTGYRWELYPVTRRTATRVYGIPGTHPTWVGREKVHHMNGTPEMLAAIQGAAKVRDAAIYEATRKINAEWQRTRKRILGGDSDA